MPNTPVVVRSGVTVYSRNGTVNGEDKELVEHMLGSVGLGMEMPEHYMDIITGLTGCGPSYVSGYDVVMLWTFLCEWVRCCDAVCLPVHYYGSVGEHW